MIFVYGTLRRGEPNYRRYLAHEGAKFVTEAHTWPEFDLITLGGYPGMLPQGSVSVMGEVFDVDENTLSAMDRLEGHPNFYHRTPIRLANGMDVEAYLLPRKRDFVKREHIPHGDWIKYVRERNIQ